MTEWLSLAQRSANTSPTSWPELRQHSIMLYQRGIAVPQESLHHVRCMQQVRSWTWRTRERVEMRHKSSKKPSRLAGSQKQQSRHKPCFAYSRPLEIHALGVNRKEGQNIYDGNYYCVGCSRRIDSSAPLSSCSSVNKLDSGGFPGSLSFPTLALNLSPYNRRSWPRPHSLLERAGSWGFPRWETLCSTQLTRLVHHLSSSNPSVEVKDLCLTEVSYIYFPFREKYPGLIWMTKTPPFFIFGPVVGYSFLLLNNKIAFSFSFDFFLAWSFLSLFLKIHPFLKVA